MVVDKHGEALTDDRWSLVDAVIKKFWAKYPKALEIWIDQRASNMGEYNLAHEGDLRTSGFRHTASLPECWNPRRQTWDSLMIPLEKIIPGFLDSDRTFPEKKNKLYHEFLKRYPIFQMSEKR